MHSLYEFCYTYNRSVVQYWWSCTPSPSKGLYFWGVRGSWLNATLCFLWFTNCVLLYDTRMLVTFGICFKQHFDTRYLAFCNLSPPRMFLPLDFQNIGFNMVPSDHFVSHLETQLGYSAGEFQALQLVVLAAFGGLTTCLLHVVPPFGNRLLNNSWAVGLT